MTTQTGTTARTIRVDDDLWNSFNDLVKALDPTSNGSAKLRELMRAFVDEHAVFVAPEAKKIDPAETRISWYDCTEHGEPHRLLGEQPWGCSVANSRRDRLAAAKA